MKNEYMTCPNCNLEFLIECKNSIGIECHNCGVKIITSNFPEIYNDFQMYTLTIFNNLNYINNFQVIKIISNTLKKNMLETAKMIKDNQNMIINYNAIDLIKIKHELERNNINFQITPEFKW